MKTLYGNNVLITGGTGFVGSHVVRALMSRGARVVVTYRATDPESYFYKEKLDKKAICAICDFCDFDRVVNIITRYEIDDIIHLCAQAIVSTAYANPREAVRTNVMGTVNILEAVRLTKRIKRVVVASSDKAYGKMKLRGEQKRVLSRVFSQENSQGDPFLGAPLREPPAHIAFKNNDSYFETDPLAGDHPYEASKSAADLVAQAYAKTYDLPIVITRFGNIYGPGDLNFNRIIPGIMKAAITGEKLILRSDGTFVRDYVYVEDVVSGYLYLLDHFDKVRGEAFNISSNDSYSVIGLIKACEKILTKHIPFIIANSQVNEIPYQHLSFEKIKKLGWKPKWMLEKGLKETYRWYQHQIQISNKQ